MSRRLTLIIGLSISALALSSRATEAQDTAPPQPSVQPQQRVQLISVTFQNAALRDVIAGIAAFTGQTILVKTDIGNPPVIAEFRDTPWRKALDEILEKQGLVAKEDPTGILIVERKAGVERRKL